MPSLNFEPRFADQVEVGAWIANAERVEVSRKELLRSHIGIEHILKDAPPMPAPYRLLLDAGLDGKRNTIRAFRKDGRDPKAGDDLYLFTGMRSSKCKRLGQVVCKAAIPIKLFGKGGMQCDEWQEVLGKDTPFEHWSNRLARLDGFRDYGEMWDWFEKRHGLPFEGLFIKW